MSDQNEQKPFDVGYHAVRNPARTKRETTGPCKICGWARHMAIHDVGNRAVAGPCGNIGHAYEPSIPPTQ